MASALTGSLFTTPEMREAMSDRAWLQSMLDFEAALARAEARAGIIPAAAAEAIAPACDARRFDLEAIGAQAGAAGNPAIPMVRMLSEAVGGEGARYVHWGATSQDAIDTALACMASRGLDLLLADLDRVTAACAALAQAHRATPMAGRTLLQHAAPIPFGLKAAVWLSQAQRVRAGLRTIRRRGLAVQLGGAAGTLAALDETGVVVLGLLAEELEMQPPDLPWHSARDRFAGLAAALGVAAGAMGKITGDVALLMQNEVGEAFEPAAPGKGGSSTMPHKRNPVGAAAVGAAVRRIHGLVPVMLGAMVGEQERAAGAWQAEWDTLRELFRLSAGAVAQTRLVLEGLEVDAQRMRANLEATRGLIMAEAVMMALARSVGRAEAHRVVEAACRRASERGAHLREVLLEDDEVSAHLSPETIANLFDPMSYMGAAGKLIERALAAYHEDRSD